ncbi:serine hydrolase [Variovorax sp. GB1P17]|uniref:serine hydrolase n=1 Tax=Variovorax sp. GB1P17 TaxID=3443740 RepID=UPI003F480794
MTPWKTIPDAQVRQILADRIDRDERSLGIAVGIIEPAGRRTVVHGVRDQLHRQPVTSGTIFEIGSITKVYTSLLLADMVERGEASLEEPVAALLNMSVRVPERGGRQIRLVDLATHTSGLPGLPPDMATDDLDNPYADYTAGMLEASLATVRLSQDIGTTYAYSNLGAALLAHALSQRAGKPYETLVMERFIEPLGMSRTAFALSPAQREVAATGHDALREAVSDWDFQVFAGAGAMRSTVDDQLEFLAANLGLRAASSVVPALRAARVPRRATGIPGLQIALGWHVLDADGDIFWHNGGTGGFQSFIGLDLQRQVGVVVLSNVAAEIGVDDIGVHLLRPERPLAPPRKWRVEMQGDPARYDGFVGRYQLTPELVAEFTREGDRLFTQLTGQPRAEVFPEGERDFFLKVVDAQVSFEVDATGRATGLVLHQGGQDLAAKRL